MLRSTSGSRGPSASAFEQGGGEQAEEAEAGRLGDAAPDARVAARVGWRAGADGGDAEPDRLFQVERDEVPAGAGVAVEQAQGLDAGRAGEVEFGGEGCIGQAADDEAVGGIS